MKSRIGTSLSLAKRLSLLTNFPCFESFSKQNLQELADLFTEIEFQPGDKIVIEEEPVDSFFILVEGTAEVTHLLKRKTRKIKKTILAVLTKGESIGLNDSGFYSLTGMRTATVTALTKIKALKMDLTIIKKFLLQKQLEGKLLENTEQMLRLQLIKTALPFVKLSHERLLWLSSHIEKEFYPAGVCIFKQGEVGDKCYLIQSGTVNILHTDENNKKRSLAVLKSPALFGEATLITQAVRNASAYTMTDCELLSIQQKYFTELLEQESDVAKMFMNLMIDRGRPIKNKVVTINTRITQDKQIITILKNPQSGTYFQLSKEGAFIWKKLDGNHTMQEITLELADKFKVFAPHVTAALILKLSKAGFLEDSDYYAGGQIESQSIWTKALTYIQDILVKRISFGDADSWLTYLYHHFIRFFYTKYVQVIFAFITILGCFAFASTSGPVLGFIAKKRITLLLLFSLIPFGVLEVFLHELGHAFTAKAFGREVHTMGIGWYWLTPIAFVDTSDMWLSNRKARMIVNVSGIYVDLIIAGFVAICIWFTQSLYVQCVLWLCALYAYLRALKMLNPFQDSDGYYLLMDWLDKNRLRYKAIIWLIKKFPLSIDKFTFSKKNRPEMIYWLACVIYLFLIVIVAILIQDIVFNIFGIHENIYIRLILPLLVVLISSLIIRAEIRRSTTR